jgi:hypothetical protein
MEYRFTGRGQMIQWVGLALALISFAYNGLKDYQNGVIKVTPLTNQNQTVESTQRLPIMTWQVAFDPNSGKLYHLHPDGKWYEQVPQIRYDQGQHSPPVGNWQGAQSAQVGEWIARQPAEASTNPWVR